MKYWSSLVTCKALMKWAVDVELLIYGELNEEYEL